MMPKLDITIGTCVYESFASTNCQWGPWMFHCHTLKNERLKIKTNIDINSSLISITINTSIDTIA
jgi:FtsP/CotA-like multicopper oxidase with cupredoxin domain